ncbi:MAG: orotidine-5'-phosphate decarboxylase [Candidatus Uhrbacteria bacterium]|nr:orotidine-5'-phosphate decarboxylase [Patescibacteria group bacterium]MBU1907255.1 orotidine-5'-phosphate decarboxylase [Patescibacteria group bacterium]
MTAVEYHPNQFLIHANDVDNTREFVDRLALMRPELDWIKIGLKTLSNVPRALELAIDEELWSGAVMLDRKLHDIPKIVRGACKQDARRGVQMMTVHCSGGREMLEAAVEGAGEGNPRTHVLGVTVLTSLDEPTWQKLMGTTRTIEEQVLYFVEMGTLAGLSHFVCSAKEAPAIRKEFKGVTLVTPGIRLPESDVEDQKRVVTPADAIAGGSDYLVVGSDLANAAKTGKLEARLEQYYQLMEQGYDRRNR